MCGAGITCARCLSRACRPARQGYGAPLSRQDADGCARGRPGGYTYYVTPMVSRGGHPPLKTSPARRVERGGRRKPPPSLEHSGSSMLEPGSCLFRWQLTLLFSLFFLWGAANNLNDVLIRQFTKAFALSNVRASLVQTCANTYVPGYLYCTYGYAYQRHGAACSRGAEHVTYGYGYQPRVCRTYHVPWHHRCRRAFTAATSAARSPLLRRLLLRRAPRRLDRAAARLPRRRHPGARSLLDRRQRTV